MATLATIAALAASCADRPDTGPLTSQAWDSNGKLDNAAAVEELAAEPANTVRLNTRAATSARQAASPSRPKFDNALLPY
jgi:hypothetical protein